MIYRLELQLPANKANMERHHFVVHKMRDAYYQRAQVDIQNARLTGMHWIGARIKPTFYVRNLMDPDNATARLKWPIDALRYFGTIVDDRPGYVFYDMDPESGCPFQVLTRKQGAQMLVLEITPPEAT